MSGFGARFAREGTRNGERWVMIANGPGRALAARALSDDMLRSVGMENVTVVVSTGYCGALDPKLRVGDIVVSDDTPLFSDRACARGVVTTRDRVAVTASEKRALRAETGAIAVDMEAAAVQSRARKLGIPFACIRVVSD